MTVLKAILDMWDSKNNVYTTVFDATKRAFASHDPLDVKYMRKDNEVCKAQCDGTRLQTLQAESLHATRKIAGQVKL